MDSTTKSRAYLIYAEWGPTLRTPRDKRLAECFPELNDQVRAAMLAEFNLVETEVWKVAEEGAHNCHTRDAFDQRLRIGFSWMNKEALDKAWFLANYYAWHEGYA